MSFETTTRDRLVSAAATLFWRKGYHGTGLAEVLAEAGVPKGSLYHHFPDGKADLAKAAADWTADFLITIINDAFEPASDFRAGAAHYCNKMAKLFQISDAADICPISALLFDGPEDPEFRAHAERVFQRMIDVISGHGRRLALPEGEAVAQAEILLVAIEGGWTLARARRKPDILRMLAKRLFPPEA